MLYFFYEAFMTPSLPNIYFGCGLTAYWILYDILLSRVIVHIQGDCISKHRRSILTPRVGHGKALHGDAERIARATSHLILYRSLGLLFGTEERAPQLYVDISEQVQLYTSCVILTTRPGMVFYSHVKSGTSDQPSTIGS
jgi:hypothetical protein